MGIWYVSAKGEEKMNYPAAELRGIRCHAGLVADCRGSISYSQHDPASSLDFWIPAFAGMTIRRKLEGYEKENTNFVPLTG